MTVPVGPSGIKSCNVGDSARLIYGKAKFKIDALVTILSIIDKKTVRIRIDSFLMKGLKSLRKVGDEITVSCWNIYHK